MSNELDLAPIEARLAAATEFEPSIDWGDGGHYMMIYGSDDLPSEVYDFYENASTDMHALLAEVRRLREELADAKAERARYGDLTTERLCRDEIEIERLRAEIAAQRLVSVQEGLPKPAMEPRYLVMDSSGCVTIAAFTRDVCCPPLYPTRWVILDPIYCDSDEFVVAYWMPLPTPPAAQP